MTTNPPQTTPIFAFFVAFDIFVVEQRRDFKFGTQVGRTQETLNETHLHTDCHMRTTNLGSSIHISGMDEARAVKFCRLVR